MNRVQLQPSALVSQVRKWQKGLVNTFSAIHVMNKNDGMYNKNITIVNGDQK
jgi:hypothetical protein